MVATDKNIREIAPDVWGVLHTLKMPGGIKMETRMTVIRLKNGDLVLVSPVPIDDSLAAKLAELGPVRHAVSPNCWHHLYLPECLERYPEAQAFGPPGIQAKRPDVTFTALLENEAPEAWRGQIDQRVILGVPEFNEVIFCHRASRTLVATDMVFNIQRPKGLIQWILLHLAGTYKKFAFSRLFGMQVKDNAAVGSSLAHVLEWDFDRVVMAHGDVYEPGAREACARIWKRFRSAHQALPQGHSHG